jgi:hypothetical protein
MTPQEAFKLGFLARCVEENLSQGKIAEVSEAFNKEASGLVSQIIDSAKDAGKLMTGAAIAAPPGIGMLGAYFANKASDLNNLDIDEIKKRELLDEYARSADKLETQAALRRYKQQRNKSKSIYL